MLTTTTTTTAGGTRATGATAACAMRVTALTVALDDERARLRAALGDLAALVKHGELGVLAARIGAMHELDGRHPQGPADRLRRQSGRGARQSGSRRSVCVELGRVTPTPPSGSRSRAAARDCPRQPLDLRALLGGRQIRAQTLRRPRPRVRTCATSPTARPRRARHARPDGRSRSRPGRHAQAAGTGTSVDGASADPRLPPGQIVPARGLRQTQPGSWR